MEEKTSEKNAEHALGRMRAPADGLDAIVTLDREGRITSWNQGARRLYGYSEKEAIGMAVEKLMPGEEREAWRRIVESCRRGEPPAGFETLRQRKDGEPIRVFCSMTLDRGAEETCAGIVLVEREMAGMGGVACKTPFGEAAFRMMVEGVRDYGIFMLNPEGKIVSWNEGAHRIKGYEAGEVLGKDYSIFFPEGEAGKDEMRRELEEARRAGSVERERWSRRKDGTRFWARIITTVLHDAEGTFCGYSKVVCDMTERRLKEDELRRSEQRFRTLIENALDLFTVVNADGLIMFQSGSVERFLGYQPKELVGKNAFEFIHPDDLPAVMEAFSILVRESRSTGSLEFRFRHKDGSWHSLEARGVSLASDPSLGGIIINSRDVTERKRLEREIFRMTETEQVRVGLGLHEGLTQHLVGLEFMIRVLEQKLRAKDIPEAADVQRIANYLSQAIIQTRDMARDLYPMGMDAASFTGAVTALASDVRRQYAVACEFHYDPSIDIGRGEKALHVYHILREALRHAATSGSARHIEIELKKEEDHAVLIVRYDGSSAAAEGRGGREMALRIMRHRAKMINGSLDLQPNAGGGVTVICSFPIRNDND